MVCTALRRLTRIELSIQCCSGGTSTASSCWWYSWNIWRLFWKVVMVYSAFRVLEEREVLRRECACAGSPICLRL